MPKETLWLNKTTDGEGAIVNVDGDVYYVELEKVKKFANDELGHGLPLDKIGEDGDQE